VEGETAGGTTIRKERKETIMKQCYIEKDFNASSLLVINQANAVLEEYRAMGYVLTLRQLYYQLVARGHIENNMKSYKRVGSIVSDARLAGLIDWSMIEDRGREVVTPPHWNSPAEIVEAAARQFAIDKWADQTYHVEVMVEKQALEGVLIPVCRELDIAFTANRGYSSSSAMREAGLRIMQKLGDGKEVAIFYMGDHDPSGMDMTRDVRERLGLFAETTVVKVDRLALNYDQIEVLNPPENPAKTTDSRAEAYIAEFGESSWELDAIEPRALADLVRQATLELRDERLWNRNIKEEARMKKALMNFAATYEQED
jgi:hypothetical protein